jgi:anti-sigma factor RsiW
VIRTDGAGQDAKQTEITAMLLLQAYADGELDAAAALAFEQRMSADGQLRAKYERLVALQGALAAKVGKEVASSDFRNRIAQIAAPPAKAATAMEIRPIRWRQPAVAAIVAAIVSSGTTFYATRPDTKTNLTTSELQTAVAGHQRSLLAAQPVDVASSDSHNVKPWFDGKLALSPPVPELASDGFPLVGGRVEIVAGRPAPTLVYKRRQHLISVVAVPKDGDAKSAAGSSRWRNDGYAVMSWTGSEFSYFAVSDVSEKELEGFVALFRSAAAGK